MPQANAAEKAVLTSSQVLDCAKQLLATFNSLADSSVLLTEADLTDAIKKEAGDSKTSQLLVATKLRDLVASGMKTRRDMASRIPRSDMASYARETEKLQNFFKTIETVLGRFGSSGQK